MMDNPGATRQTLDQRRARHAWNVVQRIKENCNDSVQKKFGGNARKLPSRIMASGLGQALAFLHAKRYAPDLLNALSHWVLERKAYDQSEQLPENQAGLIKSIIDGS